MEKIITVYVNDVPKFKISVNENTSIGQIKRIIYRQNEEDSVNNIEMQVANGKYLPEVFETTIYDAMNLKEIFSTLKDAKIFVSSDIQKVDFLDNTLEGLTTKYYTMEKEDASGLISMPIICEDSDTVAGVVMAKIEPETMFLGKYKNAFGYKNLKEAEKDAKRIIMNDPCKVGVAFYNLHNFRHQSKNKKGDLIHALVPTCKRGLLE